MPEYVLRQGAGVQFPSGPVTIRSSAGVRVEVRPRTPGTDVRVVNQRSEQVILPAVTAPLEVHLSRSTGEAFTERDQVALTLSAAERTMDPYVATLTEVHAVGQVDVVVLLVDPSAAGPVITVVGIADRPPDPAGLASDAVKRLVLAGHQSAGKDVAVAVDPSASMRVWLQGGNVRAAVDLLAGVDHGLGSQRHLDVCVDGKTWTRVSTDTAGAEVEQLLEAQAQTSGWGGAVPAPSDAHQLYLVSDSVPVHAPEGSVVVVLCRPGTPALVAGGRTEGVVFIEAAPAYDLTAGMKANPRAATDLVTRLAAPMLAFGAQGVS